MFIRPFVKHISLTEALACGTAFKMPGKEIK
jgi:hypothetical protein